MVNPFEELKQENAEIKATLQQLLTAVSQPKQASISTDAVLDINDVAALLKKEVPTIYGYVHKRQIPFYKKLSSLYFIKSEILEWVTGGKKQPTAATNAMVKDSFAKSSH